MVKALKILGIKFTFVFRHRWDNEDGSRLNREFRDYRLGFWFRRDKVVGSKGFSRPKEWGKNLVKQYMIGVNLIFCKAWISFIRGVKNFEI